jgi:hypothetical protein
MHIDEIMQNTLYSLTSLPSFSTSRRHSSNRPSCAAWWRDDISRPLIREILCQKAIFSVLVGVHGPSGIGKSGRAMETRQFQWFQLTNSIETIFYYITTTIQQHRTGNVSCCHIIFGIF